MEILHKFKDIFAKSPATDDASTRKSRKARNNYISKIHSFNEGDPNNRWQVICELGGGSEAQVFKIKRKISSIKDESELQDEFAAAKIIALDNADARFECHQNGGNGLGSPVPVNISSDLKEELLSLMNEILILRKCRHQNIVRLLETYNIGNYIWLVEEYCQHGALDSIIAHAGQGMSERSIAFVGRQLLEALKYLHNVAAIVHRDVKAGNVMVLQSGTIKLADFGIAKQFKDNKNRQCHTFIGSAFWMAPEVIICETNTKATYSFPVDIWSFGITCIEMAEINPPHYEMNQNRVLIRILKHGTPSLMDPAARSGSFRNFLQKCLAVQQTQRFTAQQLLDHDFLSSHEQDREQFENYISEKVVSKLQVNGCKDGVFHKFGDFSDTSNCGNLKASIKHSSSANKGNEPCFVASANSNETRPANAYQKDEWAESDETDSDIEQGTEPHEDNNSTESPDNAEVQLKFVRYLDNRNDSSEHDIESRDFCNRIGSTIRSVESSATVKSGSIDRPNQCCLDSKDVHRSSILSVKEAADQQSVNSSIVIMANSRSLHDIGQPVPVEQISDSFVSSATQMMKQIKIQSSPVDVYYDVDMSDLHSAVIRTTTNGKSLFDSRSTSPNQPFVLASFDPNSSVNPESRDMVSIEKTSLSSSCHERATATYLLEHIIESVLRDQHHSPSVLSAIMACLDDGQMINKNGIGQGHTLMQQYDHLNSGSRVSLRSIAIPCSTQSAQFSDISDVNERIRRRREEGRDFRHSFQMQEKRLRQLKAKQQADLRSKDQAACAKRQKTIDRLAGQEKDLINDQNHGIEKLKCTLSSELKDEIKRKRSEMDKSVRRFAECQRDELSHAKKNLLDPHSLHELEIRLFNRIEQFRQMQNQETDEYIRNVHLYHEEKLNLLKLSCLRKFQQTQKDHLKILFDLEERELCQKFQTICNHVKEFYSTMRSFMHTNQRKELEELDESNKVDRESVLNDWNLRRKNAIKYMREVCKTREKQYLQSVSLYSNLSAEQAHHEFKKFTESDHIRMQRECAQRDRTIEHKINQLFVKHQQRKQQLLSVQAQRRAQCAEKEAQKLQEIQESYALQLQSLRTELEAKMNRVQDSTPVQFSIVNTEVQTHPCRPEPCASILHTSEPWCCLSDYNFTASNASIGSNTLHPYAVFQNNDRPVMGRQSECYGDEDAHYF